MGCNFEPFNELLPLDFAWYPNNQLSFGLGLSWLTCSTAHTPIQLPADVIHKQTFAATWISMQGKIWPVYNHRTLQKSKIFPNDSRAISVEIKSNNLHIVREAPFETAAYPTPNLS